MPGSKKNLLKYCQGFQMFSSCHPYYSISNFDLVLVDVSCRNCVKSFCNQRAIQTSHSYVLFSFFMKYILYIMVTDIDFFFYAFCARSTDPRESALRKVSNRLATVCFFLETLEGLKRFTPPRTSLIYQRFTVSVDTHTDQYRSLFFTIRLCNLSRNIGFVQHTVVDLLYPLTCLGVSLLYPMLHHCTKKWPAFEICRPKCKYSWITDWLKTDAIVIQNCVTLINISKLSVYVCFYYKCVKWDFVSVITVALTLIKIIICCTLCLIILKPETVNNHGHQPLVLLYVCFKIFQINFFTGYRTSGWLDFFPLHK